MTFIERLSCVLGKQYIFKEKKNKYYNRYTGSHMTKAEAQQWLINKWYETEYESEILRGVDSW